MLAHNWFDGLSSLIGIVEGDGGDEMVNNVSLNNPMKELSSNKPKLAINSGGCASGEVPRLRVIVRKGGISVLKEGDCN